MDIRHEVEVDQRISAAYEAYALARIALAQAEAYMTSYRTQGRYTADDLDNLSAEVTRTGEAWAVAEVEGWAAKHA